MNKEKSLKAAYAKLLEVGFGEGSLEDIPEFIDENVMGYGTALDEKIMSIQEFRDLMIDQRKQAVNFDEFSVTSKPVINRISDNGNTAVIVDEVVLLTRIQSESNELSVRMSTVFEFRDGSWKLIHWHGSKPEHISGGDDPWHVNEWKQKNAELQKAVDEKTSELLNKNKELEIETALEKVRSSALAMKEPADMLEVCRIISDQLHILGVNDIRNIQTAIIDEEKSFYLNYQYFTAYDRGAIELAEYNKHPKAREMAETMKRSANAFFSQSFDCEELNVFREYRKQDNQFPDPILEESTSLHFYFYSIGPGALGISTYNSTLSESDMGLFKRFRNVFELAYRRFLDIQQAETQAKEAQIELALERVRARTMAMQRSEELSETAAVLFKEIKKISEDELIQLTIGIYNEAAGLMEMRVTSWAGGGVQENRAFNLSIEEPTLLKPAFTAWKQKKKSIVVDLSGEQLEGWLKYRNANTGVTVHSADTKGRRVITVAFFSKGHISLSSPLPISAETIQLLERFATVFDGTYTRFLDLQNAEAQARESQIQLALERVRARTMAMQKSEELSETAQVLYQQFSILGENPQQLSIGIINETEMVLELWLSLEGNQFDKMVKVPIEEPIVINKIYVGWKESQKSLVIDVSGDELEKYENFRENLNDYKVFIDNKKISRTGINRRVIYCALFSKGMLSLGTLEPRPAETLKLLERFAGVFDGTYTRYLDLQKAEAQAREARIESALEKIRSRALAMRNSSEVGNVSTLLFLELEKIDINPSGFSIMIFDEEQDKYELWRAKEVANQGAYETFSIKGMFDKFDQYVPGFGEELKSAWTKGNPFFVGEFRGEKRVAFLQANREMANYSDEAFEKMQKGWPDPTFWHLVFFKYGWFGVLQNKQLIKEELLLIHRFAEVFDFAYTRFLDLRKAEAQAREAKIEASLERVRSKTMGMQKSEELKDVIRVVFEQFVHLKINVDHAGFVVDYTPKGDWHFWIADEQDIPSKITHPYFESVWANQFNEAKENGADFFATNLNFEEKNKFYNELLLYIPRLSEASKHFYLNCPGLAATTVLFDNVSLYIENFSGIPYSDEENKILMRFGKVFQQTYTRFLDLEKAEEQNRIIQADNDRKTKELEDARQLQLSMLPKKLPQLPHIDIAVYMKTATEVGGDYYDFCVDDTGTLTVVVGDATGHGMMSGMMVSIMKSFFISNRNSINLKQFFENTNNSLKEMHLGRLMMPLIGVQINSDKLIATNAGMPSLLYFRNKSQKAGEFVGNNLPLGGMKETQYSLKEIKYEKGDTLLLMSDGFAELKNKNNEQYGYKRIISEFKSVAQKSSNEIVEYLKYSASKWMNGIEPGDDISFVVIKIRQ